MTKEQSDWLEAHPEFKIWQPQGLVSIKGWTDVGWLMPKGDLVPDGDHHFWGGLHTMSSGDTLYVMQGIDTHKVGREYYIC